MSFYAEKRAVNVRKSTTRVWLELTVDNDEEDFESGASRICKMK